MVGSWAALLVLCVTLATFVVVGVRAHRRGGGVEDFVVARNSQSTRTLGLSYLAAGMGAWILFAPPEVGAGVGLVGVLGYAVGAAAPPLALAALGPRVRRIVPEGHSLPELLRVRFGRAFHAYAAALSMLYMLVFVSAELTAAAAAAGILAGLDARVVVVAVAGATLAYTAVGGLRSSIRTDRFQAWLILALLAVAAAVVVAVLDAPGGAVQRSGLLTATPLSFEVAVTLVIAVLAANLFHQGLWQRVWAARDDATLRRGGVLAATLTVPVVLVVGGMGILAAGAELQMGSPPAPFFALMTDLPTVAVLAVLVLTLALVASSVDTLETGLASLVVAERPGTTLAAARVVTVLLVLPAVVVALQGLSVLRLFLIADLLCASAVVPALLALWPRATPAGALSGALAGVVGAVVPGWASSGTVLEGVRLASFPGAVPTLPPFAGAVVASAVVAVAVSALQRRVTDLEAVGAQVTALSTEP